MLQLGGRPSDKYGMQGSSTDFCHLHETYKENIKRSPVQNRNFGDSYSLETHLSTVER